MHARSAPCDDKHVVMALNGGRASPVIVYILNDVMGTLRLLQLGPDCPQGCYLTQRKQLVLITGQTYLLDSNRLRRLVACSPLSAACTDLLLADYTWSQKLRSLLYFECLGPTGANK